MKPLCLLLLLATMTAHGSVTLSPLFGDHAVLQRGSPIPIWGWAEPGETVSVELAGVVAKAQANNAGYWKVLLPALSAGGPWTLSASGSSRAKSEDIMIGEVWLCAGQSNMELCLRDSTGAAEEIKESATRRIRHFKVPHVLAAQPRETLPPTAWEPAAPQYAGAFTALGYHFAKHLEEDQQVTIGLINASWGGTYLEAWLSREAMLKEAAHASIPDITDAQLEGYYSRAENAYAATLRQLKIQPGQAAAVSNDWVRPDFDDSGWLACRVPGAWEDTVLPGFDGVVWFRCRFKLPPGFSRQGNTVRLGTVQDVDTCYLNGSLLSQNMAEAPSSNYPVPPDLLHEGENVLVVRVENYWEQGGFTGKPTELALVADDGKALPLSGSWKMMIGAFYGSWIRTPNVHPNLLFNGMISPLVPYAFKGVLWYQGESNDPFAGQYRDMLGRLIQDWRTRWQQEALPFLLVQLPNHRPFNYKILPPGSRWALLREAQSSASKIPGVNFAVALDLGDTQEIHPKDKSELGRRLALLAQAKVYGKNIVCQAPRYLSVQPQGKALRILFTNTGDALVSRASGGNLRGFEVAGSDRIFHPAEARIEGANVVVSSPTVPAPLAVRYAWSDDPRVDLYSASGLPVEPFRSDEWPTGSEGVTFDRCLRP